MDKLKLITEMSNKEARAFLLKSQSYCSIDLPGYFNFDCILEEINNKFEKINENNVKNYVKMNNLKEQDDINCKIYANKDGNFDWRPLEIINPYLYIYLVRYLTRTDVWYQLVNCFNNNKVERITVASIPVESQISTKDKKEQIYNWWDEVEQESIVYALDYKKIIHLDISNCYGSIYTHVISWAIHGKNHAKNQKRNKNLLGNKIDYLIQLMQNNQTNGIPQGSILTEIMMTNLKTTPLCIAIISSFINSFDICEKQKIIEKIIKKVSSTPNVDLVNIWLQRLTIKELNSLKYDTNLCEFVCGNREKIFNISWIKGIKNQVELKNIIDTDYIENMENIISPEETSLFLY
ncbi:RNA-directed DNA polymerase [Staphylococcus argenteus]|uniref:RNA-directed DNA polymerase n=1 Tax=Staphylococcus argenteus TaxID=985002 RepID=UPI00285F2AA0|nr:RNA-directed DNA polymerase [Staphylococcus argenteus]MDR7637650.1 RNA-directed DNA polymerase [Staphylococcus argenteus]HCT1624744.1 RNA-directed DNA polymerase [Staphylococcus argenteus]